MESKICRVCLDRTATISLFDKHEGVQYREKIMKCVTVSIEEGDGLPDAICENCASDISISYEFAQKCEASDRALRCLGLLQAPELKEEELKAEIKLEPTPFEMIPKPPDRAPEYDDYIDHCSDTFNDIRNVAAIQKEDKLKKKKKLHEKYVRLLPNNLCKKRRQHKNNRQLPNHLRKIKHRVYSGPIQCLLCGRILKCQSAFEQHMRTHTKENPFACDLCKKSFRHKSSLKAHINRHYGICELEQRKLRPLPEYDGRKKVNKPNSLPILCVVCGLKLNCRSALESHMRKHTGDKPFTCSDCKKSYSLKGSLMRHIKMNHTQVRSLRFICEHCGKNFYSKSNIIVHLRIHTGEKPYKCPFCEDKFIQISSLIRHKRRHTGEKPYSCETCSRAFIDQSLLSKHQTVHTQSRNFICHICSRALKTKQSLKAHIDRHNNPAKYICNYCGTPFSVKGNLNLHVARIHSEKSGMCTACHKTFPNLEIHMRVHNGEKPHVCKLCNQGFMTQRSLSHHIGFKHRDSAKFKCTTGKCDLAFPTISMLEFHVLKAHLDNTPYVCQHCTRGFLRPCDLSRHLKMNHMDHTKVKSQFIKTVQISDP